MQNPDMKQKVENFFSNLMSEVKKTSNNIKDQANNATSDVTKEFSSITKDLKKSS